MTITTPNGTPRPPQQRHPAPPPFARAVQRLSSWRWWAASTALFVGFAVVFFGTRAPFSIPTVESACGQAPPDVRFHSSPAAVNEFLAACGDSGRSAYATMQLADLVYPAVFGLFLATSLAVVLGRLHAGVRTLVVVTALPLLGATFDYLENAFAWRALQTFPEPAGTTSLLGLASAAKTTTFWIAGLLLLAAVAVLGVRAIQRRFDRRSTGAVRTRAA